MAKLTKMYALFTKMSAPHALLVGVLLGLNKYYGILIHPRDMLVYNVLLFLILMLSSHEDRLQVLEQARRNVPHA